MDTSIDMGIDMAQTSKRKKSGAACGLTVHPQSWISGTVSDPSSAKLLPIVWCAMSTHMSMHILHIRLYTCGHTCLHIGGIGGASAGGDGRASVDVDGRQ